MDAAARRRRPRARRRRAPAGTEPGLDRRRRQSSSSACAAPPAACGRASCAPADRAHRARTHRPRAAQVRARRASRPRLQCAAIISRTEWGGDSSSRRARRPGTARCRLAFVHHTVSANDYGPEDSAGIVLGIARYHRDSNGWNDIGYNFLVDQYGQVFEGRAGGIDQAVVGAQAQGYNSVSTGIATIGTFTAVPTPRRDGGARAADRLEALAARRADRGPGGRHVRGGAANRYPSGTPVTLERICGHRDGDSTTCPGDVALRPAARPAGARRALRRPAGRHHGARREPPRPLAPVQLSGELRFPDGSSPAGAPLQIQFAVPGATVAPSPITVRGADGRGRRPSCSRRAARCARHSSATAPARRSPPPRSRSACSAATDAALLRRLRRGRNVAVSGTVSPRRPPAAS